MAASAVGIVIVSLGVRVIMVIIVGTRVSLSMGVIVAIIVVMRVALGVGVIVGMPKALGVGIIVAMPVAGIEVVMLLAARDLMVMISVFLMTVPAARIIAGAAPVRACGE